MYSFKIFAMTVVPIAVTALIAQVPPTTALQYLGIALVAQALVVLNNGDK